MIAIRCDGGSDLGAGHVGRCVPIADALRRRGAEVRFVGHVDGLASWILERHEFEPESPERTSPVGLAAGGYDGALVDLYPRSGLSVADMCGLAATLPIATPGEALRCPTAGTWINYHLDAVPSDTPNLLAGAPFVPIDPRFVEARRPRRRVETVLVSGGGTARFVSVALVLARLARERFPGARLVAPHAIAAAAPKGSIDPLPEPTDLIAAARHADLAIVAAGVTAYEMACAGVPTIALALVANQLPVIRGCAARGVAVTVNGVSDDPVAGSRRALDTMASPSTRDRVAAEGMRVIDGAGADRVADRLLRLWTSGSI